MSNEDGNYVGGEFIALLNNNMYLPYYDYYDPHLYMKHRFRSLLIYDNNDKCIASLVITEFNTVYFSKDDSMYIIIFPREHYSGKLGRILYSYIEE